MTSVGPLAVRAVTDRRLFDDQRRPSPAEHRGHDSERQRQRRDRRCDRTASPYSIGPGNPPSTRRTVSRAVGLPPGSSHRGSALKTMAEARASSAAQPQLREHPIEPVRPLRDVVEEQHAAGWRVERERRAERRDQLRQRAAHQHARAPRRDAGFRARSSWISPSGAACVTRCAGTSRGRSPPAPARKAAFDHRAVKRRPCRTPASARSAATCCRCSRRTPSAAREPRRRRAAAAAARCRSRRARR